MAIENCLIIIINNYIQNCNVTFMFATKNTCYPYLFFRKETPIYILNKKAKHKEPNKNSNVIINRSTILNFAAFVNVKSKQHH